VVLFLSEAQVRQLLGMEAAVTQVERAFVDRASGRAFDIPRRRARLPGGHLQILQAAAPELNLVGYKAYYRPNEAGNCYVHLSDTRTTKLLAMIEADWLGRIRTGASSGVAVRHLARPDAAVVGLFGTGPQAAAQLEAVCQERSVCEVKVFSRSRARAVAFCAEMSRPGTTVRPADSAEETVRGSDIVVTITRAAEPLFDGGWLRPGTLVVAAGSNALNRREIDLETVRRAGLVVVDSREVAQDQSGDLLPAFETGLLYWEHLADLGDVITGRSPGRTSADQIILYESHGMGLLDVYAGAYAYQRALEVGTGTELPIGQA
jgi:ornithine cyclodeaminase/alanine dehydrogenase-like protein (mu-crystallin family)